MPKLVLIETKEERAANASRRSRVKRLQKENGAITFEQADAFETVIEMAKEAVLRTIDSHVNKTFDARPTPEDFHTDKSNPKFGDWSMHPLGRPLEVDLDTILRRAFIGKPRYNARDEGA